MAANIETGEFTPTKIYRTGNALTRWLGRISRNRELASQPKQTVAQPEAVEAKVPQTPQKTKAEEREELAQIANRLNWKRPIYRPGETYYETQDGAAKLLGNSEPRRTDFGTFPVEYEYVSGCVPGTEFGRGVKALQLMLGQPDQPPSWVAEIGKVGDEYRVLAKDLKSPAEDRLTSSWKLTEAELENPLALGAEFKTAGELPLQIQGMYGYAEQLRKVL